MKGIKRLFTVIVAATLLFAFAGCEEKVLLTPIQELDAANAKTDTLECVAAELTGTGELNGVTVTITGTIRCTKKDGEGIRANMVLSFFGRAMEMTYIDGTLYIKSDGDLIKQPCNESELGEFIPGLNTTQKPPKLEEYLRDLTRSTDAEGNVVIAGAIDFNSYMKALDIGEAFDDSLEGFSFDDPLLSSTINKDGYLTEVRLSAILSNEDVALFENGIHAKLNIAVTIADPGQVFTIDPPANAGDYKTIEEYAIDSVKPYVTAA